MKKIIQENEVWPKYYAVAYYDFLSNRMVAYPILIHLLVRWWRNFTWFFFSFKPSKRDLAMRDAYPLAHAMAVACLKCKQPLMIEKLANIDDEKMYIFVDPCGCKK